MATRGVDQGGDHADGSGVMTHRGRARLRPECSRRPGTVERADVAVAQPVVDLREQFACRSNLGDVLAAASFDALFVGRDLGSRWVANNESPCTINSFVSLAQQKFFDDTPCHRLTSSPTSFVLQCGDPTGDGTGGPGYQFANEYPTDQYQPNDPAAHEPVIYPRGTLAMANGGPNTNGSQFFMVYKDTQLTPEYTVFGEIQQDGLATLDKIAKGGVAGGGQDGKPAMNVTISSVRLD